MTPFSLGWVKGVGRNFEKKNCPRVACAQTSNETHKRDGALVPWYGRLDFWTPWTKSDILLHWFHTVFTMMAGLICDRKRVPMYLETNSSKLSAVCPELDKNVWWSLDMHSCSDNFSALELSSTLTSTFKRLLLWRQTAIKKRKSSCDDSIRRQHFWVHTTQ